MIKCPNCGSENKDHYKFCLICGSELTRDEGVQIRSFTTPTPPSGIPVVQPSSPPGHETIPPHPTSQPPVVQAKVEQKEVEIVEEVEPIIIEPPSGPSKQIQPKIGPTPSQLKICPQCGAEVPAHFKFCGICGASMKDVAIPSPPAVTPVKEVTPIELVIINPDGSEGGVIPLHEGKYQVGRTVDPRYKKDLFLSPLHASFLVTKKGTKFEVKVVDENSLNGVFVRIPPKEPIPLYPGDQFRLGQELVQFDIIEPPRLSSDGTEYMGSPIDRYWGRVTLIIGEGVRGNSFLIGEEGAILGRERGNIIFPDDGYVSGVHLKIFRERNNYYITDLGSSNGTFLRVRGEQVLKDKDFILMGQQLFMIRFNL